MADAIKRHYEAVSAINNVQQRCYDSFLVAQLFTETFTSLLLLLLDELKVSSQAITPAR